MRTLSAPYTPPFTRRPLSAGRAGTSGGGNVTGTVGFRGPSSFLSAAIGAGSSHRMRAAVSNIRSQYTGDQIESNDRRGTSLTRLRAHRSLDPSDLAEYDPLLQQHPSVDGGNAAPPADPSAGNAVGGGGGSGVQFSFDGAFSPSQGNLLHLSTAPSGNPGHQRELFHALLSDGIYGQPAAANLTAPGQFSNPGLLTSPFSTMGATAASGSNPYSYQSYIQHQANPLGQPCHYFNTKDPYSMPVPLLQREFEILRREYETTIQKLNSNMNSIKTFWSPELKRERAMRKEEAARSALIHEQYRLASQEAQRHSQSVRQLQTELQCQYELSRTIRDTEMHSVSKEQYEAVRLERERFHRELNLAKETLRDVEMQIESQRQTLAAKDESIKKLLDMLQAKGTLTYSATQDRLELEQSRARQIDLENRCRRYEASIQQKEHDMRTLREECMVASDKLRHTQSQFGDYQQQSRIGNPGSSLLNSELEATALRSLLDSKQAKIQQLEERTTTYETEISHLRELKGLGGNPHGGFAVEKSVMDREYQGVKSKVEKLELELAQKQTELQANQARLTSAEEQAADLRKRIGLTKDTLSAKEQQISLLQADVKALRGKLETRNETIEQKTQQLQHAQTEKNRQQNEVSDLNEQLKVRDGKIGNLQRKVDHVETLIKERDNQIEVLKQRIAAPQSSTDNETHKYQEQIDELNKERDRLSQQMREQSDRIESERMEELDIHRREVRDLRMAIESLQKDITDRQVLIESQQEKISDLNREVTALRSDVQLQAARHADGDFYVNEFERLNMELQETRAEVERLLKTVSVLEKEKAELSAQIRSLEKQIEESQTRYCTTFERKIVPSASVCDIPQDNRLSWDQQTRLRQKEHRVEELEEALKESVNITAEREMAVVQQKLTAQQLEAKVNQYREQLSKLQRRYDELTNKLAILNQDKQDKDSLIRSLKRERKKHLEEVLQLKEEALLAAISEKDAHIALLETSRTKNPEEVESLRRHKDKLVRKLKEENTRRLRLFNEMKESSGTNAVALASASVRPVTVDMAPMGISSSLVKDLKFSPVDQIVQSIRYVELQKKKLRVFIDQLLACMLDIDPDLLTGLPRTQQSSGVDVKLLKKLTHEQLLLELQQRDTDSLQLQRYATQLMQRLAVVQPTLVRRAMKLLDSFNGHPSTSEAFFYERLSRHYQRKQQQQQQQPPRPATALPPATSPSQKQRRLLQQQQYGAISKSTISLQALR